MIRTGKITSLTGMSSLAIATVLGTAAAPGEVHAQALQPVVDVCTGVTLPRSAVTDIIGLVNQPIVNQIEATVDALKTTSIVLAPLAIIPDLNINLSGILANAAAGAPISAQVLDTNGNIVAPGSNCNLTADGFTLDTPAGISIGGNRIDGLGSGTRATAGTLDSIAFGNGATTGAGAPGAVAIGTNASVTAPNSVALGTGSIADRGALANYTAPGITGLSNSTGSVSVGAPGALRQITNLAPGTAATDAATVGQVQGALAATAALDANAVKYTDGTHATVALDGAGGTRITGVAAGTLAPGSTDAVNGSQLAATNQNVAGLQTQLANQPLQFAQDGNPAVISATPTNTTRLVGATPAPVLVTNVAAGALSPTSTDAVNGSQLAATNQNVATNTAAIAGLDTRVTTNTSDIATNTAAIAGLDTRVTTNTSNIAANTAAIAGLDTRVTNNTNAIAALDTRTTSNTDAIAGLDTRVTSNTAAIAGLDTRTTTNTNNIATNTAAIAGLDTRTTSNTTAITQLQAQVANVPIGYVQDGNPAVPSATPTNTAALIGAGGNPVRVTNVGAGTVAAGSTDAVNGGQLAATNANVAANATLGAQNQAAIAALGANAVQYDNPAKTSVTLGGGAGGTRVGNVAAGALTSTSTDAVNGSQLAATNSRVDANTAAIANVQAGIQLGSLSGTQYANAATPTVGNGGTITQDVTFVGANPAAPVRVHNVANGTLANDAVNVSQLQSAMTTAQANAQTYTDSRIAALTTLSDSRFNQLKFDLGELRNDAFAGIAGAMAVAGLPQTLDSSRSMVAGAVSHYRGETAFAMGLSSAFNDGKAVVKFSGTLDTRGNGGVTAGAGFSF